MMKTVQNSYKGPRVYISICTGVPDGINSPRISNQISTMKVYHYLLPITQTFLHSSAKTVWSFCRGRAVSLSTFMAGNKWLISDRVNAPFDLYLTMYFGHVNTNLSR